MIPNIALNQLTFDDDRQGSLWSHRGGQLDVNLLYFDRGHGVAAHVNTLLDVWWVIISGEGEAVIDDEIYPLQAGVCLYVPAGSTRAIRSLGAPLVYASAHRTRPALMPT